MKMEREELIRHLKVVLPYPCHWYEEKSTHQLVNIYRSRRGAINAEYQRRAWERDDAETLARLRKGVS